jgi:hypothetical protein
MSPHRSCKNTCTQHGKAYNNAPIVDFVEGISGRDNTFPGKHIKKSAYKRDHKRSICKKTCKDMDVKPVALKGRHKRLDVPVNRW